MRKINKDYRNPPAILINDACNRKIVAACNAGAYTGERYKNEDVRTALYSLYFNKCGYCEEDIEGVAREQVEHYRPKGAVDVRDLIAPATHPGYYWLGNEWSNLLIACPKCNENGKKGTRFPLRVPAARVNLHYPFLANGTYKIKANHYRSAHLRGEDPLILNPETKDPDKHLKVIDTGELKPIKKSIYGGMTIEICDLNRRGTVPKRKKIIDNVVKLISRAIERHNSGPHRTSEDQFKIALEDIFDDLVELTDEKSEFTMVARCIIRNFENLVLKNAKIPPIFRPILREHFIDYIT